MTELVDALVEHLHDEEVYILPLVEHVLTVEQWQALSGAALPTISGEQVNASR